MCLCTNNIKPKTAKRPVTCYKVVWKMPWNTPAVECGRFLSEYQQFPYSIGVEYSVDTLPKVNTGDYLRISEGFHSYARLMDAGERCWEYRYAKGTEEKEMSGFYGQVILRCEIPAGASYWEGNKCLNDKGYKEYCSDRIKVTGWRLWGETKWRTEMDIKEEEPCA